MKPQEFRFVKAYLLTIRLFIGVGLALVAGCAPVPPTSPAPPPPQVVIVAISPAVAPLESAIRTCAGLQPEVVLFIDQAVSSSEGPEGVDLVIRLGHPSETPIFAAPVAEETITIITHPDNLLTEIEEAEARGLFDGSITNWRELGIEEQTVQVWIYPEGEETITGFEAALWDSPPRNPLAYLAPGPAEMLEAVAGDPGAVGILPGAWLEESVKPLHLKDSDGHLLRLPVLAQASEQPNGSVLSLIGCLQSGPGRDLIQELYMK